MAKDSIIGHQEYGSAIVERFGDRTLKVPAMVKAPLAAFKKAHEGYVAKCQAAETARERRDQAALAIGAADDLLDDSVLAAANDLVAAKLGSRQNPFAPFGAKAPATLVELRDADEAQAVATLAGKIEATLTQTQKTASKDPVVAAGRKALAGRCKQLRAQAAAVQKALAGLERPQAAYAKALAARDKLLPGWQKALTRLRKFAGAAWEAEPEVYTALFAPPVPVTTAATTKKPRPPRTPTPPAPPATAT